MSALPSSQVATEHFGACPRAIARVLRGNLDTLLSREWLLTNGRGGYASGSVVDCPTRRYHTYLIAAQRPPLERFAMLSGTLDVVAAGEQHWELSTYERHGAFQPAGYSLLRDFEHHPQGPTPWVQWTYRTPRFDLRKRLSLIGGTELITLRYELTATDDRELSLEVTPLLLLRDFHGLRSASTPTDWDVRIDDGCLWISARTAPGVTFGLLGDPRSDSAELQVTPLREPYDGIFYRQEMARGYPSSECHQRVARFTAHGRRRLVVELAGGAFLPGPRELLRGLHKAVPAAPRTTHQNGHRPGASTGPWARQHRRLLTAAGQFIVERAAGQRRGKATIIAGYPWFGDWGRDAFISLEGLLLLPRRFTEARQVLETFAGAQRRGLIPNLFDDYGGECHYNSVDASLWYIHAADRYLELSGDRSAWSAFLAAACANVVDAFAAGTDFDIRLDAMGLLTCGHENVQITWMDAKCGDVVFTPRHGRPVEVNALWYHALRILEQRFAAADRRRAGRCQEMAEAVAAGFPRVFCRHDGLGLYDCVRDDGADNAIRPNQIFAVSLAHSPLDPEQQRAVLGVVTERLLTPYGLRSLAPGHPAYKGRYVGSLFERDSAYHQGTVWSWLIGPYVEACLRVHGQSEGIRQHCRRLVGPLLEHLDQAGLGSVSEVFDGDAPHAPRACFAQAWSVAELLRALALLDQE